MLSALDEFSVPPAEDALDTDALSASELLLLEESAVLENPHAASESAIAAARRMEPVFFFMMIYSSFSFLCTLLLESFCTGISGMKRRMRPFSFSGFC